MKLYSNGLGKWAGTQADAKQFGETYHGIETIERLNHIRAAMSVSEEYEVDH